MEQLFLLGLALLLVLALLALGEQFAGVIEQLPLPLTHLDGVIGGNPLDRLAATDRIHGDPGLELGAVGTPPQRLTMGPVQKNQTSSQTLVDTLNQSCP